MIQSNVMRWQGSERHGVARAWNSNAEYSHGEVAQGRSGDGMEMSCKALIGEGIACKSKAKAWKGDVWQRQSGAERSVLGHGIELPGTGFINQGRKERNHEKV